MSVENQVKLLWDCANSLDAETQTKKLLKSYYINTCRKIAKHSIQVPKEKFAASQMCPRCSGFWSESEFRLKLKPQHLASSSKARKLISKLDEAVNTQKKGILSKKQRRRAKWLKKRVCSSVEILCETCKQKSLVPLQKPTKQPQAIVDDIDDAVEGLVQAEVTKPKAKKKKNKNKDKNAGLKIAKVLDEKNNNAVTPKVKEANLLHKSLISAADKTTLIAKPVKVAATQKPSTKANPPKAVANLSQSLKAKKKKAKKIAQPRPVQSKTQQKNTLLQLAALLKTQTKKSNPSNNRLGSLLK